jgi:hypothetical protein
MSLESVHDALWARLLEGRVTEVFLIGGSVAIDLPQALGLEPIVIDAYTYTPSPEGRPRTNEELAVIARQLAPGKRWITQGLAPFWAPPFLEHAEVILLFDIPERNASVREAYEPVGWLDPIIWLVRWIVRRYKRSKATEDELAAMLYAQARQPRRRLTSAEIAAPVLERYPEKVLRITSWDERRNLRRVRALPAEAQAPGSPAAGEPGA